MSIRVLFWGVAATALVLLGGCDAQTREANYRTRGQAFFAEKNYEKARVELNNALQINPRDVTARYMLGQVAEKLDEYSVAAGHYQATIDQDPARGDARAALARLHLLTGDRDRALELVEQGLKYSPSDPHLLAVRAAVRMLNNDRVGALEDADAALATAPDDEYVIALLCSLYRRDNLDKAVAVATAAVQRLQNSADLRLILVDLLSAQKRWDEAEAQLKAIVALEPKDASRRVELARFYASHGNPDAAEHTLQEAVTALPDSSDAKLSLVDYMSVRHSPAAAVTQLKQYLAAEPNNDILRLSAAGYYERTADRTAAETLYRAIIAHAGTKTEGLTARNRLAALRGSVGDKPGATQLVGEVLKNSPRDPTALVLDAQFALARDEGATAVTDLRSVLRDQPTNVVLMRALAQAHEQNGDTTLAEEVLREAMQVNSKDVDTRLELAKLLSSTQRSEDAMKMMQELVADAPGNLDVTRELYHEQLLTKDYAAAAHTAAGLEQEPANASLGYYYAGAVQEEQGQTDAALADYERSLEKQPQAIEPLKAAVELDLKAGQSDRAVKRIAAVIAGDPKNSAALDLQGQLFTQRKQYDEAQRAYLGAIGGSPTWDRAYHHLAESQIAAGANDAAIATLQKGLIATSYATDLAMDLGVQYERMGHPDEAIKTFSDLVEREPRSLPAAANLVALLVSYRTDTLSLDRARELSRRLIFMDDARVLSSRGWLAFKDGSYGEAVPLLEQAIEKSPDSAQLRYRLGMALLKSGHAVEARRNLEVALKSGKNFIGIQDARATLNQINREGQVTPTKAAG
jgi:tetratricopeptide (TPR) repeat protein